jgi:hypothetical protein
MGDTGPAGTVDVPRVSDECDAELIKGGRHKWKVRVQLECSVVVESETQAAAEVEARELLEQADWRQWPWFWLHGDTLSRVSMEQLP